MLSLLLQAMPGCEPKDEHSGAGVANRLAMGTLQRLACSCRETSRHFKRSDNRPGGKKSGAGRPLSSFPASWHIRARTLHLSWDGGKIYLYHHFERVRQARFSLRAALLDERDKFAGDIGTERMMWRHITPD